MKAERKREAGGSNPDMVTVILLVHQSLLLSSPGIDSLASSTASTSASLSDTVLAGGYEWGPDGAMPGGQCSAPVLVSVLYAGVSYYP